jgi:hypothetical protein
MAVISLASHQASDIHHRTEVDADDYSEYPEQTSCSQAECRSKRPLCPVVVFTPRPTWSWLIVIIQWHWFIVAHTPPRAGKLASDHGPQRGHFSKRLKHYANAHLTQHDCLYNSSGNCNDPIRFCRSKNRASITRRIRRSQKNLLHLGILRMLVAPKHILRPRVGGNRPVTSSGHENSHHMV